MTQLFQFTPSSTQNFKFQPFLDGDLYTVTLSFPVQSQRYFMTIADSGNNTVLYVPVRGSTSAVAIGESPSPSLAPIYWDEVSQRVYVSTTEPFAVFPGWSSSFAARVGTSQFLTISGCTPDAYNGTYECLIEQNYASFPLTTNPGAVTVFGQIGPALNLIEGYFTTSTMVFLSDSQQFIVTP